MNIMTHKANDLTKYQTIDSLVLFMIALLFYSYRLAHNPIWFDEALIYLSAQRGLERLIFYSSIGPHPPFYYVLQWVLAGMGEWQTEWAWRWFPMLCGATTIPLLYILMRRWVSRMSALLGISLLLFAPTYLFFSQESRPYAFLVLLVTISIFQFMRVLREPNSRSEWVRFGLVSLIGIYSSYSYSFIIMGQFAYLTLIMGQWKRTLITTIPLLATGLPLLRSATPTLTSTLEKNVNNPALNFSGMLQSLLVSEPLRYGKHWGHDWMPLLFGLLMGLALLYTLDMMFARQSVPANSTHHEPHIHIYHLCQVILPPLIFFTICTPLLDIRLPLKDAKQFIVLFPSFFILIAIALDYIQQRFPKPLGILLSILICCTIYASDVQGISRYWQTTKSADGLAVRQLKTELQPDDGILSFHYSPSSLISFYIPHQPIYAPPRRGDRTKNEFHIYIDGNTDPAPRPLAEILTQHPRFWVFHLNNLPETTLAQLDDICALERSNTYGPFTVLLYHCPQ